MLNKLSVGKTAEGGAAQKLRIQPELNLDYPGSDISDISLDETTGSYNITTTFFGLYGVSSPLPGFYTEELLDDEWDELSGRKHFFDVIHNHIYPLLYEAWLKYKFTSNIVEFENRKYAEIIFDLIGLEKAFRDKQASYDYLLKFSGLLSQRIKTQLGLKTLLQGYLGNIGVEINPCIEHKVSIVDKQQCLVAKQNVTLGVDACIGNEVASRNDMFSIEIGPLDAEQFVVFSQGGEIVKGIKNLINIYLVQPLEYDICLLLLPGAIKPASLGDRDSAQLGINCWFANQLGETINRVHLNIKNI